MRPALVEGAIEAEISAPGEVGAATIDRTADLAPTPRRCLSMQFDHRDV